LIHDDDSINQNYKYITSIKGIGLINAIAIIVCSQNFTRFDSGRKFACYAGVVPFGKSSGTSVYTRPRISKMANQKIKALLTEAAKCTVRFDKNFIDYYQRKKGEAKEHAVIINNVRNKLIQLCFALVRNQAYYDADYINCIK